jgi:hypothetical protein
MTSNDGRPFPSRPEESPLSWKRVTRREQCRCGTRIAPGEVGFEVITLPEDLEHLFRGRTFCSLRCISAYCLESLEILDALDTPEARAMAAGLHELSHEVAEIQGKVSGR